MKQINTIGVVGLWHLGCVVAASWLKLGHRVVGIDFCAETIDLLAKQKPPIYEPELEKTFQRGFEEQKLIFSFDPAQLKQCDFVFLAYDTPVDDNDYYDLRSLEAALVTIAPHLQTTAVLIVSSQVPVGTCGQWQKKMNNPIVYSPENLRLGEAVANYLNPGHIVIGSDCPYNLSLVKNLFTSIPATYLSMDWASAEMTKHAINAFLASSITFANQLSDACSLARADFYKISHAMKQDPRIGSKAYLNAGIGFSGGTLGRDLQILNEMNKSKNGGTFPLFGNIWQYNKKKPLSIVFKIGRILNHFKDKTVSILGITYKPGTSTLRRSIPLEIAQDLARKGVTVKVYDPKANWQEGTNLAGIVIFQNPYEIGIDSDFLLVLTPWPEFQELDFEYLGNTMHEKRIFDPYGFLMDHYESIQSFGFQIFNNIIIK
jgi:UDPglucose 6-dehydrogenase